MTHETGCAMHLMQFWVTQGKELKLLLEVWQGRTSPGTTHLVCCWFCT